MRTEKHNSTLRLIQCLMGLMFLIGFCHPSSARPGGLDQTFSSQFFDDSKYLSQVIIQPDGKILVRGGINFIQGKSASASLFRLNPDGSLDRTFNAGSSGTSFGPCALAPDGKIVVQGILYGTNGTTQYGVGRLHPDGSIDQSLWIPLGSNDQLYQVRVLEDGRILLAGRFSQINGVTRKTVARLLPDGTLDPGFDPGNGPDQDLFSMAVQGDGKILLSGLFTNFNGFTRNRMVRLNSDGTVDQTFDVGLGPALNCLVKMFPQSDGKIMCSGNFPTFAGQSRSCLVRLNSNGTIDPGFSSNFSNCYITEVHPLSGGKFLVLGDFVNALSGTASYVAQINSDGSRDTGFSPLQFSGKVEMAGRENSGSFILGGSFEKVGTEWRRKLVRFFPGGAIDPGFNPDARGGANITAVASQPDGKLLVGGEFTTVGDVKQPRLARVFSDGRLDPSFVVPSNFGAIDGTILVFVLQPDGKILVGGGFTKIANVAAGRLARLNPDGTLDATFAAGTGFSRTDFYAPQVTDILVQPDGKLIVSGNFTRYQGQPVGGIVRLLADGTLDPTFQTGAGFGMNDGNMVFDIAFDASGRILVGGEFTSYNGTAVTRIARLLPNGQLDPAFVQGSTGPNWFVKSIGLGPDGSIYLGGSFSFFGSVYRPGLLRLNADGTLDTAFNPNFWYTPQVDQVQVQTDGAVIVCGKFTVIRGLKRPGLARFLPNGMVDPKFEVGDGVSVPYTQLGKRLGLLADGSLVFGGLFSSYSNSAASGLVKVLTRASASTPGQFRPGNGFAYLRDSNDTGFANREFFYGQAGDIPLSGDWDGDGTHTLGIFRNGTFFLRNSNDFGFADVEFPFGAPGDIPIVGDWDGDGIDTVGIVRGNSIFLRNANSTGNPDLQFTYGTPADIFIAGDWNGDGIDTIGCFRPANGFVYLRNANTTGVADQSFFFGQAGDRPVVGDWNADGIDSIGIVRGNEWFLRNTNDTGFAHIQFSYGTPADVPVVGDWDGR